MAAATRTDARSRSPASARATEQRYESPWSSFRPSRFSELRELLLKISQRPVTEDEFRDAMYGASEHTAHPHNASSRSKSHLLSTMARSITALIHTRDERNPAWHEIIPNVIDCARRIANKSSASERSHVIQTLYDFLSNRCDYAAIHVLLDQALAPSTRSGNDLWHNVNDFEHQLALSILEQSSNIVEAKLEHIKFTPVSYTHLTLPTKA